MIFQESILTCVFFCISGLFILTGIPIWVIGISIPKYYLSEYLYSVPLFPESAENKLSFWSFSGKNNQSNKLTYPISTSDFPRKHFNKNIDVHIIHNLWGIRMSGSIQKNNLYDSFQYDHNINQDELEFFNRSIFPGDLPQQLRQYGNFRVKCPFSTLITQENQIEPKCTRSIGSFINLKDSYETIPIGTVKVDNSDSLSIIFNELQVLPYDFVFTPQMFIGFWKKSVANKLVLSGWVLTVTGITILVISIIVFFAFSPSGDDVGTDRN